MNARETFLQRVRQAVVEGNRAGAVPGLPERGTLGYQGAGTDLVRRFGEELANAGGLCHVAADPPAAWQVLRALIQKHSVRKVAVGCGGMVEALGVTGQLQQQGLEVTSMDGLDVSSWRAALFGVDLGISNVEHLVAETGSVVMATSPEDPRSLSLLPPVHIAIARRQQLLPDLFDLFDLFSPISSPGKLPPSCLTLITGPSKTGDIELRLVTGVHGPGEIHVILCTW